MVKRIRILFLLAAFCLANQCGHSNSACAASGCPDRPATLPEGARWHAGSNAWLYSTALAPTLNLERLWNRDGSLRRVIHSDEHLDRVAVFEGGLLERQEQLRAVSSRRNPGSTEMFSVSSVFGRVTSYSAGRIERVSCRTPAKPPFTDGTREYDHPCFATVAFRKDGTVNTITQHDLKCAFGCGEFRPIIESGHYRVVASALNVRTKPSTSAPSAFTLKKDDKIEVLEDTHKIETHSEETAPWVKIKSADGKTGYAFAGFIRKPDEVYVDMSIEGIKKLQAQLK